MKIYEFYVFKDETHIDWKATEQRVVSWIKEQDPNQQIHLIALEVVDSMRDLRKVAKRYGVAHIYKYSQKTNEQAQSTDTSADPS